MWENIIKMASESGIWAALFVALFVIQLRDSKAREAKYQTTIDALADKLKMIADVKTDVEKILENVGEKSREKGENAQKERPETD